MTVSPKPRPRTHAISASLALALLTGCAASGGVIGLEEPAIEQSVALRSSPFHSESGLGWRLAVDRLDLEPSTAWRLGAAAYVPFFEPTYLLAEMGVGTDDVRWNLDLGIGSEFDLRQTNYFWGIFAEGGGAMLVYREDLDRDPDLTYFARVGLYFCIDPLPCGGEP